MKKITLVIVLAVCLLFMFSCKTTSSSSSSALTVVPTTAIEEAFVQIYDKYSNELILNGAQSHTVRSGDTLYRIATAYYPDGYYYPVIMLASKSVVLDPDKIAPGMVLTIPDLQRNLNSRGAREAIKGAILECADIEKSRNYPGVDKMKELANSL
ncbi:MAG: LysM peptidoglycan-binding domain-containing protein [Treponema sp.]|nr:LysM peptidoglycan-binding domain-containing protein [Treponema sp.]